MDNTTPTPRLHVGLATVSAILRSVSYDEAVRRGRKYGLAHNYVGGRGGWIYRATGTPNVNGVYTQRPIGIQGWARFFHVFNSKVRAWEAEQAAAASPSGTLPEVRYEVRVTRDSVTRASIFTAADARQTVHEAVSLGYPVSCRELPANEKGFKGVREVKR